MRDPLENPAWKVLLRRYNSNFKMLLLPICEINSVSDDKHLRGEQNLLKSITFILTSTAVACNMPIITH